MKTKFSFFLFLFFNTLLFSQKLEIKKDIVYVDGKECLKIISSDPNNIAIADLEGKEIIFLKFIHDSKYASLYNKITFLEQNLQLTSKSYIFNKRLLLKKLVESNVLNNCKLDPDKVKTFVLKYDENVER